MKKILSFILLCVFSVGFVSGQNVFFEGFESGNIDGDPMVGWTQADIAGAAGWKANTNTSYNRTPNNGTWNATLIYGNTDWMFKAVSLTGGVTYTLSFYARQDMTSGVNILASYGAAASVAGMTNSIFASTAVTNGNYQSFSGTFTPASTGTYYIGIRADLNTTPWYISIDDISLDAAAATPNIALSTNNITAGNIAQASTNNPIYSFAIKPTLASASLTGLKVTTTGTYASADITNLKCYYQSGSTFNAGTATLLSTLNAPGTAGLKTFPSFTSQTIAKDATGYIFITADVACAATTAKTIAISAVTGTNTTFALGTATGTPAAGNTKTISVLTSVDNVTGASASVASGSSSIFWTNPSCIDEVMIVAAAGTNTGTPTGNGSAYTANLTYGSGTALGNGYVVYKGSTSPQTVTGLTNGTNYCFKIFTRKGSIWSSGVEVCVTPAVSCNHTIKLTDTYGDGWSGNKVTVYVNGIAVLTDITLLSGGGPETHTFPATSGEIINVKVTTLGSFLYESRIEVLDGASQVLLPVQQPVASPGAVCLACCAPVPPDTAKYVAPLNQASGLIPCAIMLKWEAPENTGCNEATSYDVYFGTTSTPPLVTNTTLTTYTTAALSSSTTYYWKIAPKNVTGSTTGGSVWSFTTASSACAACTHTIRCISNNSAGWWSTNTVTVQVNGIDVLTDLTVSGIGTVETTFSASQGDIINVSCWNTLELDRMKVEILDNTGASLFGPVQPTQSGANIVANCSACFPPASIVTSVSPASGPSGTPVTFSYVSHTGGICAGSWEYQWETTGGTVLRAWSTSSASYTTNATADMFVVLKMRCSQCPTITSSSNVLNFDVAVVPPNNNPCNAIMITPNISCVYEWGSNMNATNSGVGSPGCANFTNRDVWYKTTVPGSGNLEFQTDVGTMLDGGMAIYSGTCTALTLIECNDDDGPGSMSRIVRTGLTPGATIWIRIWGYGGSTGTFQICVSNPRYIIVGTGGEEAPQYGDDCVIITPDQASQGGCVWNSTGLIDFSEPFDYAISVYLGDKDNGADGMTFSFQRDPAGFNACGEVGGNLGMKGVSPSWSVEIDTYDNGTAWFDIAADHLTIFKNGDNSIAGNIIAGPISATNPATNIEDGLFHTLRVVWNPSTKMFSVFFDGQLRLAAMYDIVHDVFNDDPMVYWGFTGATGEKYNLQYFCPEPNDIPLPLTFVQFAYTCRDNQADLTWVTASEMNTDRFFIERSMDLKVWEHIDYINASGNTNELTRYKYTIDKPEQGSYYRIKEVDVDGKIFYSGILQANCNTEEMIIPVIYPNPADDMLYIEYCPDASINRPVDISIFDINGKLVVSHTADITEICGSKASTDISHLSKGYYVIQINDQTAAKVFSFKLQVIR